VGDGEDVEESQFILSNAILDVSSADEDAPMGFSFGVGETSTPSLLDAPEETGEVQIEYASVFLKPVAALSVKAGLLGPNSGFESTYTFENRNIFLGTLASQQPYNAYGVKASWEVTGEFSFWGGCYGDRLDDEEYNGKDEAWEIGAGGEFLETNFNLYHYHVDGYRYLTGVGIDRSLWGMDAGVNVDSWTWDEGEKDNYKDDSSLGLAVYVRPVFGAFSLPVRLEYVDQGKSMIYTESADAETIFTASVTPTYNVMDNAFIRAEVAYVQADGAFADDNGKSEDNRFCFAAELGYMF